MRTLRLEALRGVDRALHLRPWALRDQDGRSRDVKCRGGSSNAGLWAIEPPLQVACKVVNSCKAVLAPKRAGRRLSAVTLLHEPHLSPSGTACVRCWCIQALFLLLCTWPNTILNVRQPHLLCPVLVCFWAD